MDLNVGQIDLKQEAGPREKIYFAVILLLIVVSFTRWFYIPKLKDTKMLQVDIKNNLLQVDTLKKFAQLKIPEPEKQNENRKLRTGTKFEKAVEASMQSPQQVVADVIKMMTSSNVLNGISLTGVSFASEVNKGTYGTIPTAIDLEGKYSGLLGYLEHVEKFGKLLTVDNVEVNSKPDSASKVQAKVNASIYVVYPNPTPQQPPTGGQNGQPPIK